MNEASKTLAAMLTEGDASEIYAFLKEHQTRLSVEEILEAVTQCGAAPSLLNDDNGYWTVGGDGTQNVLDPSKYASDETVFAATWWIEPNSWKPTIREAIAEFLDLISGL